MTSQAILADVNLDDEKARFPPDGASGRRAETLLKTPRRRASSAMPLLSEWRQWTP